LRERAGIGDSRGLRRGAGPEDDAACGRPNERLDHVVDAVERGHFVGDDLDDKQSGDDRHHPAVLEPCPAVRKGDQFGEPRKQAERKQRDIGIEPRRGGQPEPGQQFHGIQYAVLVGPTD
jgi:hypothetical protein